MIATLRHLLGQLGGGIRTVPDAGNNVPGIGMEHVILACDISVSMEAQDWKPSRLHGAKQATQAFVEQRARLCPGDSVALVAFHDVAKVVMPFTCVINKNLIMRKIMEYEVGYGTSIGAALAVSEGLFDMAQNHAYGVIALYTDGDENIKPMALPIARRLKRKGITICTVGIGGTRNAVNENLLRSIASEIDGKPAYQYISDIAEMVRHYREMGANHLVHHGGGERNIVRPS